jgi:signal transduction histidine kinase
MDSAARIAARPSGQREHRLLLLVSYALTASAAAVTTVAVAASGAPSHPALVGLTRGLIMATPIAIGLYVWQRPAGGRFGLLLIGAGAGCFVTTLAESRHAGLYTVGRTAGWLLEVLVVYLVLAFPSGRLSERVDRVLVGAMGVALVALFLPRLALANHFDVPSRFTSCVHHCPPNALFALHHEPAVVDGLLRPLGAAMVLAVMIGVGFRLWQKGRQATPLTRRTLGPIFVVSIAVASILSIGLAARQIDAYAWTARASAWLLAFAVPAIAVAFLAGLLRWRLFAARALQRVAESVRSVPTAITLRRELAAALDDPALEIAFPVSEGEDGWIDGRGLPLALPGPGSGRSASAIRTGPDRTAVIIHDEALSTHPELVNAAAGVAALVLDNHRLAAEAAKSLREVQRSRARIATSAERERRRIERDLHDGAQQRLVALRIELELAENLVRHDPERGVALLRKLEGEVEEALDELRALAHGVYPPLLADRGLPEALRAAGTRCTIPVDLRARDVGRYPPEVESAVYFCVLEALQNALKHAKDARQAVIRLDGAYSALRFSVRDNGGGTPDGTVRAGAGITNMRDRLAAVGGDVEVISTPGESMEVRGSVPIG